MVLLELFWEVGEGKASSLFPGLSGLSLFLGPNLCMGAPGGLYRPTPRGYNSNPAGHGSQPSVSQAVVLPAGFWASRLAGPADKLDTVAVLLMMQARSSGRGNSAAVYRAIAVATPHLI